MTRDMKAVRKASDKVLQAITKVERAKFALRIAEDDLTRAKDAFEAVYNQTSTPTTTYKLVLEQVPRDKMIHAIKAVREITNLGLKEAKDLVDTVMVGRHMEVYTFTERERAFEARSMLAENGARAVVVEKQSCSK